VNSNNLKRVRMEIGISVSELARRTKLSRLTISNIENCNSNPTATTMKIICQVLHKSPSEIFFDQRVNRELQNEY
jgi:transcriptional regulator with XRE-family HTH domain